MTLPVLLTTAEVAKALKVSAKTVQREVADGRMVCTMVRKSMRFTEQQVLEYLEHRPGVETAVVYCLFVLVTHKIEQFTCVAVKQCDISLDVHLQN